MYITIFDPIPWTAAGISALQTFILYWLIFFLFRLIGRRVFGEFSPHDVLIMVLIADASNLGLTHDDGGFWASLASILTIITTVAATEKIAFLRQIFERPPISLVKNGKINYKNLRDQDMDMTELKKGIREKGVTDFKKIHTICLEDDGSLSVILKKDK